jgi:hypothetical protein
MADPKLPLNGENAKIIIFGGTRRFDVVDRLKTFKCDPKVTEHDDSYIGSDADETDQQVRGWTFEMEGFHADAELAKYLLEREEKRRRRQRYDEISIGIILENRTPTPTSEDGFILQKCEIPPLGINVGGATERIMDSIRGRARNLVAATF